MLQFIQQLDHIRKGGAWEEGSANMALKVAVMAQEQQKHAEAASMMHEAYEGFFKSNAGKKQKLAVLEKIIACLRKMGDE